MELMPFDDALEKLIPGVVVSPEQRGLVRLTGPQRAWFLQNTITNEVESVDEGVWVASCFLDLKGKVLAHFRVGIGAEEILLDVDPPGVHPLLDWFVKYRFRTKVEIEQVERASWIVVGQAAKDLAAPGQYVTEGPTFGDVIGDVPIAVVYGDQPSGLQLADARLVDLLGIRSGEGKFGVDYGADTLPQEAGLTSIVSVSKGCYVGQEVIARIHFRGHINKVLRPLTFTNQPPEAGTALKLDGQTVGRVTSSITSRHTGPIGLGMISVGVPDQGKVTVDGHGEATVGPIPPGTKTDATPRRLGS